MTDAFNRIVKGNNNSGPYKGSPDTLRVGAGMPSGTEQGTERGESVSTPAGAGHSVSTPELPAFLTGDMPETPGERKRECQLQQH
jgi:hypothetical protein